MASVSEEDVCSRRLSSSQTQTGGGQPRPVGEEHTEAGLGPTRHYCGTGWGCHLVGGLRGGGALVVR